MFLTSLQSEHLISLWSFVFVGTDVTGDLWVYIYIYKTKIYFIETL